MQRRIAEPLPLLGTDPRKVIKDSRKNVELIRACLPIGDYIKLLHIAIVTGQMPVFDTDGVQVIDQFTSVSARDRVELTKYMIDKAMPNTGPTKLPEEATAIDPNSADLGAMSAKDMTSLSEDELRQIVDADFTVSKGDDADARTNTTNQKADTE